MVFLREASAFLVTCATLSVDRDETEVIPSVAWTIYLVMNSLLPRLAISHPTQVLDADVSENVLWYSRDMSHGFWLYA